MDFNKKIRYMADNSSVNGILLATVFGKIKNNINNSVVAFVPCVLDAPQLLKITPLDAATLTSFGAGFHVDEFTTVSKTTYLADNTNLPAMAHNTAYVLNEARKFNGKIYLCINAHTSPNDANNFFVATNWKELLAEEYIKVTFGVTPGASARLNFAVQIDGLVP